MQWRSKRKETKGTKKNTETETTRTTTMGTYERRRGKMGRRFRNRNTWRRSSVGWS